jgi:hypothetical protein
MLGAFRVVLALKELLDLLQRERSPFLASCNGIALDRFETDRGIDWDEAFLCGKVEHLSQGREVLLLGHWREQGLVLSGGQLIA